MTIDLTRLVSSEGLGYTAPSLGGSVNASAHIADIRSRQILRQLAERRPVQIDVLAGLAELYRIEKRPFDAFVLQDRILRINPNNREAQRQRILLAAELGAADQAVRLAERQPGLLTPEEMEKIRREQAIQIAGWGGLYNPDARYAETDAAIGLMQQQLGA